MPYRDPEKRKEYERNRYQSRLAYWRDYRRKNPRKLNPSTNKSRDSIGFLGELEALSILKDSKRYHNRDVDLVWRGKTIDVKTAIKSTMSESKTYSWKFTLSQKGRVDFFLFILKGVDRKTERVLLIPDEDIKPKSFRLAESKLHNYDKYIISYST